MAKVIAVLNQKGGVGKTTISSNLGEAFKRSGLSVLLVDSDPQGSLRDWNEASKGEVLPVIGLDRETLPKDLEAVKQSYDIVIIDGAPQSNKLAGAAVKSADLVLVPVTPSPYDVWACFELVDLIKTRQDVTDGKPQAGFLISRARKGTKLGGEVAGALHDYELPVLNARTIHREVYAQTATDGLTIYHTNKPNEAVVEIEELKKEILEVLEHGFSSKDERAELAGA